MKKLYAITSRGKTLKSILDVRFGRCEYFVLFDPATREHTFSENPFKESAHAGVLLAGLLLEKGVTAIVTGEVGPMVQQKLEEAKIPLALVEDENVKIETLLARIKVPLE